MTTQAPPAELLTPMEAAFRLGHSMSYVYRLLRAGAFEGVVDNGDGVRIPARSVDAYAEAKAVRDAEAALQRGPTDDVVEEAARDLLTRLIDAGHLPPEPPPSALKRIGRAISTFRTIDL